MKLVPVEATPHVCKSGDIILQGNLIGSTINERSNMIYEECMSPELNNIVPEGNVLRAQLFWVIED